MADKLHGQPIERGLWACSIIVAWFLVFVSVAAAESEYDRVLGAFASGACTAEPVRTLRKQVECVDTRTSASPERQYFDQLAWKLVGQVEAGTITEDEARRQIDRVLKSQPALGRTSPDVGGDATRGYFARALSSFTGAMCTGRDVETLREQVDCADTATGLAAVNPSFREIAAYYLAQVYVSALSENDARREINNTLHGLIDGALSPAEVAHQLAAGDPARVQTQPAAAVAGPGAAPSEATADNEAILRMIQYGDLNRAEIVEAITDWWVVPHEPKSLFPVIAALTDSPRLRSKIGSIVTVECASVEQPKCIPALAALKPLGLSVREADSPATSYYVLVIVPGEIRRSKEAESEVQQASTFTSGYQQVPNPQYFALQNQLQSAQLQYQSAQQQYAQATQMPAGFAAGYAQGLALRQMRGASELVQEIATRLQSESPTLSERVQVPYTFSVVTTRALYQQRIGFALFHRRSGSAWASKGVIDAQESFKVANGRNQHDDGSEDYPTDGEAADRWLAETRSLKSDDFARLDWSPMPKARLDSGQPRNLVKVASRYFVDARPDQQSASGPRTADRRFRSVVVVKVGDHFGSGFFIGPHNVITNAHVVGAERGVTLRLYGAAEDVTAEVIAADAGKDLALLRTPATGTPAPLLRAGGDVPVGARLVIIGHPRGLEFSLTSGVVSAVRQQTDGGASVEVIQTDTALNPGNSGGPVFLGDKVVGVATYKRQASEGLGFAVHSDEIRRFLTSAFLQ